MSRSWSNFAWFSLLGLAVFSCGNSSDSDKQPNTPSNQAKAGAPGAQPASGVLTCAQLEACMCDDDPSDPVCTTLKQIVSTTTMQNGAATAEAYCQSLVQIQPLLYGACLTTDQAEAGAGGGK